MGLEMLRLKFAVALVLSLASTGVDAVTQCSGNRLNNNNNGGNAWDGSTTTAGRRVIGASGSYTFDCCGILSQAAVQTRNGDTVTFEIWRPSSSSQYTKIWSQPVSTQGSSLQNIAAANSVTVHRGDVIAWHSMVNVDVRYDTQKGDDSYILDPSGSVSSVTVTSAEILPERGYIMDAVAVRGNTPTVTTSGANPNTQTKSSVSAGTTIFTLTASDQDVGQSANLVLTKVSGVLELSSNILSAPSVLEKGTYYTVVKVVDECAVTGTATFTLIISNTAPTFTNMPGTATVSEDASVETSLYAISTSDVDGDSVTCDFASGTAAAVTNNFQISPLASTTSPYVLSLRANAALNYDTTPSYTISVTCTDGTASITSTITVSVLQNTPPTFINLPGSASISSSLSTGSTIFTVSATDAQNDQVNYTMTCSPSTPFKIFPSGAVILSQSILGTTTATYTCSVTVYDHRGSTGPSGLTINISDLKTKPVLQSLPTTVSVNENSAGGTVVYTFNISDADGDTSFSYQLSVVPTSGSVKFATIDSSNRLILATGESLDYESDPISYSITVTAFDGLLTSDSKVLTVTVNDVNEAPVLDDRVVSYFITNRENVAGTVLPDPGYQFTDPDAGDTHTYSLVGGVNSSVLTVNSATGRISFARDYDVDQNYLPQVIVPLIEIRDSGGLAVTATVTVSISDYNDNAPTFAEASYVTSILKFASVDTSVFTLTATDRDSGTNAQVKYSLTQQGGLSETYFAVNDEGQVYVLRSCSDLSVSSVSVTVTATDQGSPQLSGSYKLTILLLTVTKGFFSYPGNVAWLSAVCVLGGAAALLFGGFLLFRRTDAPNVIDALRDWYRKRKARWMEESERQREMKRRAKEERRYQREANQRETNRRPISPSRSSYRPPASNPNSNNGNPYDVVKYNTNYDATRLGGPSTKLKTGTGPLGGNYDFWNVQGTYKF